MTKKKKKFTFIDLFSGIGSFHYSFKQLGGECVLACDIDQNANSTYIFNYGVVPQENIWTLADRLEQIPDSDLLCAGFPCQAFSKIGLKKAWKDTRAQVFYPLLKILKYKQIPCIILENVPGLVNLKKGQVFNTILNHLKDLNYECFWKVLNCSDYGIPQNRKRLFIVGFHKRILQDTADRLIFEFPPKTNLQCTLSQLFNKNFNQKIARTIRIGGRGSPLGDRHNWDGYTILKSNLKIEYRLSIQDCLLLQNFSKNFQLCGCPTSQYKQIGNTIPTNLSFALGKQIIKFLKQKKYFQHKKRIQSQKPQFQKIHHFNYGELWECIIKVHLLCFQNQHIRTVFGYIQKLENQPNQPIQNKKLTLFKLYTFTNAELINCFVKSQIFKSKNHSKADIFINDRGVSIKIFKQGFPAIVNHTHRQNFLRVLKYLKLDIQTLDTCISEYHCLRQNYRIGEDILNSNPLSPFHKFKSYFIPILKYFLLEGSGRGVSQFPADTILLVKPTPLAAVSLRPWASSRAGKPRKGPWGERSEPPMSQNWYWFSNSQQFIDLVWDFLVFSIRDKGLNYEKRSCGSQKIMDPWVHQYRSKKTQKLKKKGCLHIRIHNSFEAQLQNEPSYKFFE